MRCAVRITPDIQKEIFERYWVLGSFNSRLTFAIRQMTSSTPKIKTIKKNLSNPRNRNTTFNYFFLVNNENIAVCKKCFQQTLDETERFMKTVQQKHRSPQTDICDMRGKQSSTNKLSEDEIMQVKIFLNDFPAYESHYTRRDTSKKYFDYNYTIHKFFELYTERYGNCVSESKFYKIFREVGIKIKKPQVDTCGRCDSLKTQIRFSKTESKKLELQDALRIHVEEADIAFQQKKSDKIRTENKTPEEKLLVFDLEKCLATPRLNSNIAYYKRNLNTFNLTVYDAVSSISVNYMWHEGIANRGGNEIASSLYDHLSSLELTVKRVVLYSDSCMGQNKNSFVASMFGIVVANSNSIDTIEHKFLTPGHTRLDCDMVHSVIEKCAKKSTVGIFHPRDYYRLVENCSRKFKVKELKREMIFDFGLIAKTKFTWRKTDEQGNRFSWLKVRWLKFTKQFGRMKYKNSNRDDEPFKVLTFLKRGVCAVPKSHFCNAYDGPNPISVAKKRDLEQLLPYIDPEVHEFYRNLTTDEDISAGIHPDITEFDLEEQ